MTLFIIILAWVFVIYPMYKAIRKQNAAKQLNIELDQIAYMYEYAIATYNFSFADSCLEQAKEIVHDFTIDIKLTPQELYNIAPSVGRFPGWQTWI